MNTERHREKTLARFVDWNLEPNHSLPFVESAQEIKPKNAQQVAARAVAAGYIAALCFGAPSQRVQADLRRFGLWSSVANEERKLFSPAGLVAESKAYHAWLVESIQFMVWALQLAKLDHFAPCDSDLSTRLPSPKADPSEFIASSSLRSLDDILQEADTLYMLHWRVVQSSLDSDPDDRVVLHRISFRRHAADWIVGTAEEWDEVSLDT